MRVHLITALLILSVLSFSSVYHIVGNFNPEEKTVSATLTLNWSNPFSESTKAVLFNLFPNLHEEANPELLNVPEHSPGWIEIEDVKVNGENAEFDLEETFIHTIQSYSKERTLMRVHLPLEIPHGSSVKLEIGFKTHFPENPSGDESCWGNVCLWRFGWYPIEVYSENGKYSDGYIIKPHECDVNVEVPKGWEFITHGGTGVGCPFVALRGYEVFNLRGEGYRVHVHYRPGNRERAIVVGGAVLKALSDISERFGDLDYKDVHILQLPLSGLFGMTTSGLVVLGDNAFSTGDLVVPGFFLPLLEFLVYHEVAHLWFGIGVEPDFFRDNFLSESLAQYVSITEMERIHGPYVNLYDDEVKDIFVGILEKSLLFKSLRENYLYIYRDLWRSGLDSSVKGPHEYLNQNFPLDYAKGYFALRTLEVYFGSERFDDILREFHEVYENRVVSFEKFLDFLTSKDPRGGEIAQKLFESKSMDLSLRVVSNSVEIQAPEGFPYEVLLTHTDGSTELVVMEGSNTLDLRKFAKVDLDPDWKAPDPDRFDNHHPPELIVEGMEKKEISPLEAYRITPAFFTATFSSSDTLMSAGFGIQKFDEWGFSIQNGYHVKPGEVGSVRKEILGISGFHAGPYHALKGTIFLTDEGVEYGEGEIDISIPEKLNVGMEVPLLYTRSSVQGLFQWVGEPVITVQYSFVDPVKTGFFSRVGVIYYGGDLIPFGDLVKLFNGYSDIHIWGIFSTGRDVVEPYSLAFYNPDTTSFNTFGSISLGLHLNISLSDRLKLINFFSLRGGTISARLGVEGGTCEEGVKKYLSFENSFTPELYSVLDQSLNMRFFIKVTHDLDARSSSFMVGIDSDLPEIVITELLTENPLVSHVHLPVFRIHLSKP